MQTQSISYSKTIVKNGNGSETYTIHAKVSEQEDLSGAFEQIRKVLESSITSKKQNAGSEHPYDDNDKP